MRHWLGFPNTRIKGHQNGEEDDGNDPGDFVADFSRPVAMKITITALKTVKTP